MRKPDAWVFGSVATVSQEDLDILYCEFADRFGLTYKPEAVVATCDTGAMLPALCYIAPAMSEDPADPPLAADLAACVCVPSDTPNGTPGTSSRSPGGGSMRGCHMARLIWARWRLKSA